MPPGSSGTAVRLEPMHGKRLPGSEHLSALTARMLLDKLALGRRGCPYLRLPRRLRAGGCKERPPIRQRFSAKRRPPQGERLRAKSLVIPAKAGKPNKVLFESAQPRPLTRPRLTQQRLKGGRRTRRNAHSQGHPGKADHDKRGDRAKLLNDSGVCHSGLMIDTGYRTIHTHDGSVEAPGKGPRKFRPRPNLEQETAEHSNLRDPGTITQGYGRVRQNFFSGAA